LKQHLKSGKRQIPYGVEAEREEERKEDDETGLSAAEEEMIRYSQKQ